MSKLRDKYVAVIGLEVHAQLLTNSKMYAPDSAEYGGMPNTNVSMITLGHPGTLPKVNKKAIEYAIKMGLATNCKIRRENQFARKNYFYADLPKGYQITQDTTPICYEGHLDIKMDDDVVKRVGITRIHLEEDAGKSMHDQDENDSLIDLNRAGTPLVEIVSEPDIRSADEAYNYLGEIRKILRYLEICDGNMEEGSMRCDANVSVMLKGADKYGERCEVKNMNSIRNVHRAIEFEIDRQIEEIEKGNKITQDTRSFDANTGTTFLLRSKEDANDYRYFPEPDLPPFFIEKEEIESVRAMMPALPHELQEKYVAKLGLSEYDANVLTDSKEIAMYFEDLISHTSNYKTAANWVMGNVKSYLNDNALHIKEFPIKSKALADILKLVEEGKVSNSVAGQKLFPAVAERPNESVLKIAEELNILIQDNPDELDSFIKQAMDKYPDKVEEYRNGKKGVLGLFMGELMKISKGKIDPKAANTKLRQALEQ